MSFDLSIVPESARALLLTLPEEHRAGAWETMLAATTAHLAKDKDAKKAAREAAKAEAAKNKADKLREVAKMCEDIGIEPHPPKIVKSLHRTDKKVKSKDPKTGAEVVKTPQVLCGIKLQVEGISGSLDLYISTGKGARVTEKTEVEVAEAHALALRLAAAIEEAGFSVGAETDTEDSEEE